MAHSDILIFLTNISWIFFLFLSCYFFFVLFFLPSFYKKVRARTLARILSQRVVFTLLANAVLGSFLFLHESTKILFTDILSLILRLTAGLKYSSSIAHVFVTSEESLSKKSLSVIRRFSLSASSSDTNYVVSYFKRFGN